MTQITKPLSTYDIAMAIHSSSLDVGTLCKSTLIAPWAKYKPVRRSKPDELTEQDRAAAHYGMAAPSTAQATAPYYLIPYYDQEMNGWQYLQPRGKGNGDGGSDEWYRMLDFDGYEHNPLKPVRSYSALGSILLDSNPSTSFQMATFIGGVDTSGASIELKDIATILNVGSSGLYFGVALFKGTGLTPTTAMAAATVIATASSPIAKTEQGMYSGTVVDLIAPSETTTSAANKGLWTVVPFLCVGKIEQCGAWTAGQPVPTGRVFYPVPYASISELDAQSRIDTYTIAFKGTKTLVISGVVTIKNKSTEAKTLTLSVFYWDESVEAGSTPLTRHEMMSWEREFPKTVTIPGKVGSVDGEYVWNLPVASDSRLIEHGAGYVVVSGEGVARGPFYFYSPLGPDEQVSE